MQAPQTFLYLKPNLLLSPQKDRAKQLRIVIADDDPLVRAAVSVLMGGERNMTIVGEAQDGNEALALAQELDPDVVLLDLNMPKKSGLEALRELYARNANLKVILLTVALGRSQLLDALQSGARGVVLKDCARSVLVEAVKNVAQGSCWVDKAVVEDVPALIVRLKSEIGAGSVAGRILSPNEKRIISFIVEGRTNKDIAQSLLTSEQVVKNYLGKIFDKLGVFNRLELALYALDNKLAQRP